MTVSMSKNKELAHEKHIQYLHATYNPETQVLQIDKCMDPVVMASTFKCIFELYKEAMMELTVEEQLVVQAGLKGLKVYEKD